MLTTPAAVPTKTVEITSDLSNVYTLTYRQGNNPYPLMKYFANDGGLNAAIERGKRFCENTNNRFILVRPLISNLAHEEKRYMESE